jgi:hypothetical protein
MRRLVITTVVDKNYFSYIPLFIYCVKKAYPEYDIKVFTRGKYESNGLDRDYIVEMVDTDYGDSPYITAGLRFLQGDDILQDYEYVLITDIDVMIKHEEPDIIDHHIAFMIQHGLDCYSNSVRNGRMSGVHFVTNNWWKKTKKAREDFLSAFKKMLENGAVPRKDDDEIMLANIVELSGLHHTSELISNIHGLHLGKYRTCKKTVQAGEDTFYWKLMKDPDFIQLIDKNKCELLDTVFRNARRTFDRNYKT